MTANTDRPPIPYRTIMATIGLVMATIVGLFVLHELAKVVAWLVVAAFIAVVLSPAVQFLETRVRMKRGLATLLVFLLGLVTTIGLGYTFVRPLIDQATQFAEDLPGYVEDAKAGRGAIGRLVQRYDVDTFIEENQDRFQAGLRDAGAPALDVVRTLANTVFAAVTILVLAFLMLLQGPNIVKAGLSLIDDERRRHRLSRVMEDCSRAVTGYMAGNLLISAIAGASSFLFLSVVRVPFSGVLALWVAFADLIPLVGATLGAVPAVLVAFLHSTWAGVLTLLFFIAYQQFENHVLQVTVMSRTVDLNPLVVLVSVLVGVEMFGILGALLAIPGAGVIQVIVRDVYDERRGRLKPEPTVGVDERPIGEPPSDPQPAAAAKKVPSKRAPAKKSS